MPRQKTFQRPVLVQFKDERATKQNAIKALRGSGYTLSDYLRTALADLAEGRVRPVRPEDERRSKPLRRSFPPKSET